MRSTFRVLFYTKNQAIKNGRVPIMGRITVNGTTVSFSCKRDVPLALWDARGNCAKGKSEEARRLNQELENIKAQIGKHYQYLTDHDSFPTAKKVYDRYNGFGEDIHSLMEIFDIQIQDYKRQIGKTKAQSTYQGLVLAISTFAYFIEACRHFVPIDIKGLETVCTKKFLLGFLGGYCYLTYTCRNFLRLCAHDQCTLHKTQNNHHKSLWQKFWNG